MKEIIYLNTDLMNSMLAQLDKGLVHSFSLEQNAQETESESQLSQRGESAGLSGKVKVDTGILPGGGLEFGANLGNEGSESFNTSRTILEGQKDILNKAFHDHALEILTSKLKTEDKLVEGDPFKEGDLYLGKSTFNFYDFDTIRKSMNYTAMESIILSDANQIGLSFEEARNIVSKAKPNARERQQREGAKKVVEAHNTAKPIIEMFKTLNIFSNFASDLLDNLCVIKTNNKIGLMKKEYMRESSESLSFRTDKSREIHYLVRVIGQKEIVYDGSNLPQLKTQDLDKIPNFMIDVILGSFDIIKKGDILVTPIAIYYE